MIPNVVSLLSYLERAVSFICVRIGMVVELRESMDGGRPDAVRAGCLQSLSHGLAIRVWTRGAIWQSKKSAEEIYP